MSVDARIVILWMAIVCLLPLPTVPMAEVHCDGIEIRNTPTFMYSKNQANVLRDEMHLDHFTENCTVMEGSVVLAVVTKAGDHHGEGEKLRLEDFIVFKNVREITGYLLIFQVDVLDSVGRIFPKLRVVHGRERLADVAIAVFQNPSLETLGLDRLTSVGMGGVRITENRLLCGADNVNWTSIVKNNGSMTIIENNQPDDQCEVDCKPTNVKKPSEQCQVVVREGRVQTACWNSTTCQIKCDCEQGCYFDYYSELRCCHRRCSGGCVGPTVRDCYSCKKFNYQGSCIDKCPEHLFDFIGRRCMTAAECKAIPGALSHFKPVDGKCVDKCPQNMKEDTKDPHRCILCDGPCPKKCAAIEKIQSVSDAMVLEGCNIVMGSVEIGITSGVKGRSVGIELEKYLGSIEEIEDHLFVSFTPSLYSLGIFKNLKRIRGKNLRSDNALTIFENINLAKLFPQGKVQIMNGSVNFRNNPQLCPDLVIDFIRDSHPNYSVVLTDNELVSISRSNGEGTICKMETFGIKAQEMDATDIEGKVVVLISWELFNTTNIDHRSFLGYELYYKKLEEDEVPDMFGNRDACEDSWAMDFVDAQKRGEWLPLDANSRHAFYVKTAVVSHPDARGAISDIVIFRTSFTKPTKPRVMTRKAETATSLFFQWLPPTQPNGDITYYTVSFLPILHNTKIDRNYCERPPTHKEEEEAESKAKETTSTRKPFLPGDKDPQTCSLEGCCNCSPEQQKDVATGGSGLTSAENRGKMEAMAAKVKEDSDFENAIHDYIFIAHVMVDDNFGAEHEQERRKRALELPYEEIKRLRKRSLTEEGKGVDKTSSTSQDLQQPASTTSTEGLEKDANSTDMVPGVVNVTREDEGYVLRGLKHGYTLTGLNHFTRYEIEIRACQNMSHQEASCSDPVQFDLTTLKLEEKDAIPGRPKADKQNATRKDGKPSFLITWQVPPDPNGRIAAYNVYITKIGKGTKNDTFATICTRTNSYLLEQTPGKYSVEIQAVSLGGVGRRSLPVYVVIEEGGIFTTDQIIIMSVFIPVFIAIVVAAIVLTLRKQWKKDFRDHLHQFISANPDYLSTMAVYKVDEWEIVRKQIELLHEIGHGTFGNVYAGTGKDVKSLCGVEFGPCAVKTVREDANDFERITFLREASIMKQYNTAFIVKLYGVVSEGQPALMVMEMMEKGNLRDYLRTRRPLAEENVDNLSPPTVKETSLWAIQIADGMAYLETLKFVHRDLAARNCMVSCNNVCKIGDFGMARDVYVTDYYRPEGRRLMPVRWMSPEALKDAKFSPKSDMWSYGVVLWEIVTLAQQPYQGLGNEEIIPYVVKDRRCMEMPIGCPPRLYELMLMCWRYIPSHRPEFITLVEELLNDIEDVPDDQFRTISFVCSQYANTSEGVERRRKKEDKKLRAAAEGNGSVVVEGGPTPRPPLPSLSGSPATADGSECADSDTPLNPFEPLNPISINIDLLRDSDADESPVCNSNRRIMPKSRSTPSWGRKSHSPTPTHSIQLELTDTGKSSSNGPLMANGHIPAPVAL